MWFINASSTQLFRGCQLCSAPCCLAMFTDLLQQDVIGQFPLPVVVRCESRVGQDLLHGPQLRLFGLKDGEEQRGFSEGGCDETVQVQRAV